MLLKNFKMIYIVDDFYPNPDEVREQALKEFFYPGRKVRRQCFLVIEQKEITQMKTLSM